MKQVRGKSCFTLLELVIAVSITMVVALALYSYSHGVVDGWGQMLDKRNKFRELLRIDQAVDHAFAHAVPFTWQDRDDDNREYPFFIGDNDRIRLAYLHLLKDEDEGALRFAELEVDGEGRLLMTYTDRPFWDWGQVSDERYHQICLAEEVASVRFVYVDWDDQQDNDWGTRGLLLDEWETASSERKDLPLGIGMVVTWRNGTSLCWFRRTMGNSYRERYGAWEPLDEDKRE